MADLENIRVQDIFDMDFLQKFQDTFARAVGMTAVTVDADGKPIILMPLLIVVRKNQAVA